MLRHFILVSLIFCLCSSPVWAETKHLSKTDKLNNVNAFNKVTDYFATMGKTDLQKASSLQERKAQRRAKRLQSLQSKKQKAQIKKQQKIISDMKKVKGL